MFDYILSIILTSIISIALSDKIIDGISKIMVRIGIYTDIDITGKWEATFFVPRDGYIEKFTEVILVKRRFGTILGYIDNSSLNYNNYRAKRYTKILRVRGYITDNRYFTGFWHHPDKISRYHGAFQLLINGSAKTMRGIWTGYSEQKKHINSGEWVWKRCGD